MARIQHALSALGLAAAVGLVSSADAQVVYETSFESSTPDYTLGDLQGQDGWQVDGTASVTAGDALDGADFVNQSPGSSISQTVSATNGRVIVRGFYKGDGVASLAAPPDPGDTPMAAVIGFRSIGGGEFTVAAWDGDPGQYVEAGGTPGFQIDSWNKIIVNMRFDTKDFDVVAGTIPIVQEADFHSSSVVSMSEFLASAEVESNVDLIGIFQSDGDYDNDGVDDDVEMTIGSDPILADTDGDGFHDGYEVNTYSTSPTDATDTPVVLHLLGQVDLSGEPFDIGDYDNNNLIDSADLIRTP